MEEVTKQLTKFNETFGTNGFPKYYHLMMERESDMNQERARLPHSFKMYKKQNPLNLNKQEYQMKMMHKVSAKGSDFGSEKAKQRSRNEVINDDSEAGDYVTTQRDRFNVTHSISTSNQVFDGNKRTDGSVERGLEHTSPYGQGFIVDSATNRDSKREGPVGLPRIKQTLPKTQFNKTDYNTPFVSTKLTGRKASNAQKVSETSRGNGF